MVDTIRRTLLLGLGAAALTRDRIEQFIGESVARGEMSTEQGKSLVEEMTKRAEQERQKLETFVTQQVSRALDSTGLSTRSEITRLESRVVALESRLRDLSFSAAAAEPSEPASIPSPIPSSEPPTPPAAPAPPTDSAAPITVTTSEKKSSKG